MTQLVNQEGHVLLTASMPGTNASAETGCGGRGLEVFLFPLLRCRVL